ncbi:MAG TPA: ABC transporter permease [Roseiflexaceae bacterium]|nr:ABC transporter permease [Roseiflexaceae bacterium]
MSVIISSQAEEQRIVHDPIAARPPSNLWRDAAIRFSKNKLAMGALVVVALFILMAVFADVLAPHAYDYAVLTDARLFPGEKGYLLGTDEVGRDMLSRLIYGARISLIVGFSVQLIALTIGVPLGLAAGFLGGWVDFAVMRVVEVFTAIPQLLFALFLISILAGTVSSNPILGNAMVQVVLAIGLIGWVDICRLTRAQLFSLREKEFIEAARTVGVPPLQIALRHLLPNALTPLIIAVTLGIPTAIFTEAGLSFLGLGINDPLPSWGKMVGNSFSYIRVYWHLGLFPTLLIATTMLSFSFVGDGLRDALDPRLRK